MTRSTGTQTNANAPVTCRSVSLITTGTPTCALACAPACPGKLWSTLTAAQYKFKNVPVELFGTRGAASARLATMKAIAERISSLTLPLASALAYLSAALSLKSGALKFVNALTHQTQRHILVAKRQMQFATG